VPKFAQIRTWGASGQMSEIHRIWFFLFSLPFNWHAYRSNKALTGFSGAIAQTTTRS